MKTLNWRPWQPPLIDFGVNNRRCNLLARMGMGKTPAPQLSSETFCPQPSPLYTLR